MSKPARTDRETQEGCSDGSGEPDEIGALVEAWVGQRSSTSLLALAAFLCLEKRFQQGIAELGGRLRQQL